MGEQAAIPAAGGPGSGETMVGFFANLAEIAILAAILCLAFALTQPLRRRWGRTGRPEDGAVTFGKAVLAYLTRPLAVIVLTAILSWLVSVFSPAGGDWIASHKTHLAGWGTFWTAVLVFYLVEATLRQAYASRGSAFPVPDLIASIIRIVVFGAFAFGVLRFQIGLNITPLLASTALVTAVVGFALQGVLGNLLSGMSLHIVRSLMPSDWIALDGVEGEVVETNWRETRLRTTGGHIVIVPNSTMAAATIHNMTRPTPLRRHRLFVGASYSDAPAEVIEALVQSALSVPAVRREPAPAAYLVEFKDFGINYELQFWTERYPEHVPINGEVGRMIWYQFKRRGIEIPFPMSDKLLNQLAEVVAHQRRLPPEEDDVRQRAADLMRSDLVGKMLVDGNGQPLLQERDVESMARLMKRLLYTRGEIVFRQDDCGESCYIVARGRLRGRIEGPNHQAHEFEVGAGAIIGEMSLMAGLPRTATISTEDEVELLEMNPECFARLLALRPEIPEHLSRLVADRGGANAEAIARLKAAGVAEAKTDLRREGILKRFMRITRFWAGGGGEIKE